MRSVIFVLIMTLLSGPARAAELPFQLKPIGPGVYAAIDGPEHEAGANAGFVIGDDGVLVIDSFFTPDSAKALLAEIVKLTDKPIRYVVNTHYHIDHTGGDAVFRAAGATIIAHRNVRGWVRSENAHLFGARLTGEEKAQIDALPLPDLVTDHNLTLWLGGRRVEVRAVLGHTGGDLVVEIPEAKVLFCGDMLWTRVSPNIIDGTVRQWIATLGQFRRLPGAAQITYVPGHGELANADDVKAAADYLSTLELLTEKYRKAGLSGEALSAAVIADFKPKFGSWDSFDQVAPREVSYMAAELAGTKRVPIPRD